MDPKISKLVKSLEIINPDCIIILQEEIGDEYELSGGKEILTPSGASAAGMMGGKNVKIFRTEQGKDKSQTAVGRAVVLKKSKQSHNPILALIKVGDRIVFNPGSQRSAGYNQFKLLQIIHAGDILFKENVDAKEGKV